MGDRGNIVIIDGWQDKKEKAPSQVWLYTHWGGSTIASVVRDALAKNQRWNDGQYLARIVYDVLLDGQHSDATGFGITDRMCDNEHKIVVVDTSQQLVVIVERECVVDRKIPFDVDGDRYPFEEFAALTDEKLPDV